MRVAADQRSAGDGRRSSGQTSHSRQHVDGGRSSSVFVPFATAVDRLRSSVTAGAQPWRLGGGAAEYRRAVGGRRKLALVSLSDHHQQTRFIH